jgi:hypothetical protein
MSLCELGPWGRTVGPNESRQLNKLNLTVVESMRRLTDWPQRRH